METIKEAVPSQPELDPIEWRRSLRRTKRAITEHVPLILASVFFSFVLLAIYYRTFPPIFVATAVIQAETNDDVVRSNYYSAWNLFRKGDLKSEPQLIISGRVATEVVTTLGLTFDDVHHSFLTHVAYLWTESWLGRTYRSFKEWLLPPDPSKYRPTPEQIELARTIDAFKEGVSVEIVPGTAVARITVKAPTYRAADFANKVVEVYLAERRKSFLNEADASYNSLMGELKAAEADLAAIDRKKLEFESKNKVVLDFEKDKLQVASWSALKVTIEALKANIASDKASLEVVEQQLKDTPKEIISGRTLQDSKVKSLLQSRVFDLSASLESHQQRYLPNSPEIRDLRKLLDDARNALAIEPDKVEVGQTRILNPIYSDLKQKENNLRTQIASATAALAAKSTPLAEFENRMARLPDLVLSTLEQGRVREGLEMRYKILRDRAMQASASRATAYSAPSSVQIIDNAFPPTKASWPKNIILFPSTLALGLFVGIGLALWAEVFSSRVNRDRIASRPDIPVYAVINLRPETVLTLPTGASADHQSVVGRLRKPP